MGVSNSRANSSLFEEKFTESYELVVGKEGFTVLVGSERNGSAGNGVVASISALDNAFNKTCRMNTYSPFSSPFSIEDFDRFCLIFFDKDMLHNCLSHYSCYFYCYCGHGNDTGMLTVDNQCIPYINIITKVLNHSLPTHKPTVFIFDCHFTEDSVVNIESIIQSIADSLGPNTAHVLVCFSFSSIQSNSLITGNFTAHLANTIQQYSHLFSLTELIDLAGSRAQFESSGILQGPLCLDYMKAQLMLTEDPSAMISMKPKQLIDYCCTQIETNFASLISSSDSSLPGQNHSVLLLFANDACGSLLYPNSVYTLANSLTLLGFKVFCDCINRDIPNRDWIRWYSLCVSLCNNVILVCSPLLMKAFADSSHSSPNGSCSHVLTEVRQQLKCSTENKCLRFFEILLSAEYNQTCVPTLFASGRVYYINDEQLTTPFDHTHIANDYHSLIFGMSDLPHPPRLLIGQVKKLSPNDKQSDNVSLQYPSTLDEIIKYFYRPVKKGYKVVTQVQPFLYGQTSLNKPYCNQQSAFTSCQPFYPGQPYPPPSLPLSQPPSYFVQPPSYFVQPPSYPVQPPSYPVQPPSYPVQPPSFPVQPPSYQSQPPSHPSHPISLNIFQQMVTIQAKLWLSGKVIHWKFLGRQLGLDEYELEQIEQENPRDLSEQCYQAINKWTMNCKEEEANYGVLAAAVEFAENQKMRNEFIKFVIQNTN